MELKKNMDMKYFGV